MRNLDLGETVNLPAGILSGESARLIPVVADTSREVRATSVLLAALQSVPAFAKAMLATVGQSVSIRSTLSGFTETKLAGKDGNIDCRPDGYLLVERGGKTTWSALIEAKIGNATIDEQQLRRYIAVARTNNVSAVVTVSNQFVALPTHHPIKLPKSVTRNVEIFHWSWMHVLTQALLLMGSKDLENQAEKYILGETIRYFSHPSVGASTHDRMNPEWRELVSQVQAGATIGRTSDVAVNTVEAWHEETRDLALLLTRRLGETVTLRLSRAEQRDPALRTKQAVEMLTDRYTLECTFVVPNAASPINLVCDLRRRAVEVSMRLAAPADRQRPTSRLNWLLRQLQKTDPAGIHLRVNWPGRTPATQATLEAARNSSESLLAEASNALPSSFDVLLIRDLAGKFSGRKTFLEEVEAVLPYFYEQVGQHLRPYIAKPPSVSKAEQRQGDDERPDGQIESGLSSAAPIEAIETSIADEELAQA